VASLFTGEGVTGVKPSLDIGRQAYLQQEVNRQQQTLFQVSMFSHVFFFFPSWQKTFTTTYVGLFEETLLVRCTKDKIVSFIAALAGNRRVTMVKSQHGVGLATTLNCCYLPNGTCSWKLSSMCSTLSH
jgi:hypothetical protein